MQTGIILLGHGSKLKSANQILYRLAQSVRARGGWEQVEPAFLQFERPSLADSIAKLIANGTRKIAVVPFFLLEGSHVQQDIPRELQRQTRKHPEVEFSYAGVLGSHPRMVDIILDQINQVASKNAPDRN